MTEGIKKLDAQLSAVETGGREEMEGALHRDRDLVSRIMATSPVGIAVLDRRGRITFANDYMERGLALTRDEISGRAYNAPEWRITAYDGTPFPQEQLPFVRVMATGQPVYDVRHAAELPDGRRLLLSVNAAPLFDEAGQIDGVVTVVQDVTEWVQARESGARLGRVLDDSLNEIYIFDATTLRFVQVNRGARENLGYSIDELRELTPLDLKPEFAPQAFAELVRPLRDGQKDRIQFTTVHRRKDGSLYPVEVYLQFSFFESSPVFVAIILDITERVQAEEALRRSEERYRLLVEHAPLGILSVDPQGNILDINPALLDILGSPSVEATREINLLTFPPLIQAGVADDIRRCLESGEVVVSERKYTSIWGKHAHWRLHLAPISDGERVALVQLVAEDVTERVQAEEKRREHEGFLALLNDITRAALETPDLQTMLQMLADRMGALLGADGCYITLWDEEQQKAVPTAAYGPMRDNYPSITIEPGEVTMMESVLRAGHPLAAEDVFDTPYLSPRIAAMFPVRSQLGLPLLAGDEKLGAAIIAYHEPHRFTPDEIAHGEQAAGQIALAVAKARLLETERRQRELAETLRQVTGVLNTSLDRKQVLDLILEQLARVVEYNSASLMLVSGEQLSIVAQRDLRAEYQSFVPVEIEMVPLARIILAERRLIFIPDTAADPRWLRLPGDEYIRCWLGVPLMVQGRAIGQLNLDHEQPEFYTEHHARIAQAFANQAAIAIENARLYEDLQRRVEELERAQAQLVASARMAAIGQLAGGVAHQINNPLQSVLGFAQLAMARAAPDDPIQEDLAVVAQEALRARDVVQGLLTFSRQTESFREQADLNQVLWETLALVRQQFEASGVRIEEVHDTDLPLLSLSVGRMQQVFLTLFTNALDAMPRGGTLTLHSQRVDDQVAVRITDTGMGIPEEALPRIFEPFLSIKPAGQGTGLGLSVSLGIVQDHGGRIEVESREGEGSTFTVWLPLVFEGL